MGGNENDLPFLRQDPDDGVLVDTGIFRLVDEDSYDC